MRVVPRLTLTAILCFLSVFQSSSAFGLGIGVRVIPGSDQTLVGGNTRLWFAVSPGKFESREIEVLNTSNEKTKISIALLDAVLRDGKLVPKESLSPANDFLILSNNNFVMDPNSSSRIKLTFAPPVDALTGEKLAMLSVSATSTNTSKISDNSKTRAIGRNDVRFNMPIYLIIGDTNELVVDFEIQNIRDFSRNNDKVIHIIFKNLGTLPLGLKGSIQFTSIDFEGLKYGPFDFGSEAIRKSESGRAEVILPSDFQTGKYKVLVIAHQSNIEKTRIFEKDLTFPVESRTPEIIRYVFFTLLFICLLFFLASFLTRKLDDQKRSKESN